VIHRWIFLRASGTIYKSRPSARVINAKGSTFAEKGYRRACGGGAYKNLRLTQRDRRDSGDGM
jgi:hypothetical protein